ncbi:hypothetical protein [Tritonibacter mobilis]|uniref:hypothetical protein n=1 Tax=Tritonibacter mobilis TaxID=379347 RepID=UPI003A5C5777
MTLDLANTILQILSLIVATSGFCFVVISLRENRKSIQTSVAVSFMQRFADLEAEFPLFSDRENWPANYDEKQDDLGRDVFFRKYLYLCSEEFRFYTLGRIPEDIWEIWRKQIETNFNHDIFIAAWEKYREKFDDQADFQEFMDKISRNSSGR